MTTKPKNLLVILSDEHRRDAMGCAGHPIVKTPNLDRLAARGTLFENAYTPCPMCVPARAALATGDYPHRSGHWDSATPYAGTPRSWMHDLRQAGIPVTSIGKLHFRSGEDDNGFSEEILPMHVVGGVGWAVGLLRENPPAYDSAAELAADVGTGPSTYTDYDKAITKAAEDWLGWRLPGQPWAGFVSLVSPHYPLMAPQAWSGLYDPAEMPLPTGWRNQPDHPELANIRRFFAYDSHFDEARTRQAIAAYYGLTSFLDDCVGRILAALEASGQAEDTLVIYASDHGEMLGDQGYWTKQVMYEGSSGVPMIVAGPGVASDHRVKTPVSLLDVAATARGMAGVPDDTKPGQPLPELAKAPNDMDRSAFSEYHDGGSKTGTFMVRWQGWKYVHYVDQPPQLFDLDTDPNELTNLAGSPSPGVLEVLEEGEKRLREICDPEQVNARAFADQSAKIAELGGEQACREAYVFNHTPTPSEQEKLG